MAGHDLIDRENAIPLCPELRFWRERLRILDGTSSARILTSLRRQDSPSPPEFLILPAFHPMCAGAQFW